MPRDPRVQLNDIELAVRRVLDKAGSTSLENYLADRDLLDIVERQMIIIGEAASQLKKQNTELADCLPDISQIIGFRHRVVHGYWDIDHQIVYRIIQNDLPVLLRAAETLLNKLGRDVPEVDL